MFPTSAYGLLCALAKDLRKTQARTRAVVCGSFTRVAKARSFEGARQLVLRGETRLKGALGRYCRFVGHSAADPAKVWGKRAGRLLLAAGRGQQSRCIGRNGTAGGYSSSLSRRARRSVIVLYTTSSNVMALITMGTAIQIAA